MSEPIDILLVEDNIADVRLLEVALEDAKLLNKLRVVYDGIEAMEFLRHEAAFVNAPTPDLLLLDWNLPRKNGREVLEEIKNDPELRLIPVVVLTVSQAESDILQAYDLNADAYISKPVDVPALLKAIRLINGLGVAIVRQP